MPSFQNPFPLAELNGRNGFKLTANLSATPFVVDGIGDVNGDGIDDMIFGNLGYHTDIGITYVLYGSKTPFPSLIDLSTLNGTNGYKIIGEDNHYASGFAVSGIGDMNGDGLNDFLIGTYNMYYSNPEYIVFGSNNTFSATVYLSELNGTNGFKIITDTNNRFGYNSVAGVGDINGDGLGDSLILSYYRKNSVEAVIGYVLFGSKSPFSKELYLSNFTRQDGFKIIGTNDFYRGKAVAGKLGDINGDGFDDFIIGNPMINSGDGAGYVIYGSRSFPEDMYLSELNGKDGFKIGGAASYFYSYAGTSVSGAGDVNGDGFNDILMSVSPGLGDIPPVSYIIFGKPFLPSEISLQALNETMGLKLGGVIDSSIRSCSGAGDINDDGFDDIILGAPSTDSNTGTGYVVYGSKNPASFAIDLPALNGTLGFKCLGKQSYNAAGNSVSKAGDVNGDGIDDFMIGTNDHSSSMVAFVVFGSNIEISPSPNPTPLRTPTPSVSASPSPTPSVSLSPSVTSSPSSLPNKSVIPINTPSPVTTPSGVASPSSSPASHSEANSLSLTQLY